MHGGKARAAVRGAKMSSNDQVGKASPEDQRSRLARELEGALEEVVFDLEHGIPWSVIHRLDAVGRELAELAEREKEIRLKDEVALFRQDVSEIFADRDAAKEVVLRGQHIVALLQTRRDGS
jgi:hypothetical protein